MTGVSSSSDIHARLAAAEAALAAIGQSLSPDIHRVDVAVLIPCRNAARTIAQVVAGFRTALPAARIYVYDNNSHDETASVARQAGATVRRAPMEGEAGVIRRMFADVDADVYVLVEGDGAYDAAAAPRLVSRLIETQADMVIGARITPDKAAYPSPDGSARRAVNALVSAMFGDRFTDALSGYRVFTRRYVKSASRLDGGFGTAADLTLHALDLDMITTEVQTTCYAPASAAASTIERATAAANAGLAAIELVASERPLWLFGALSLGGATASLTLALPMIGEVLETGAAADLPTVIASAAGVILSGVSLTAGLVLESVSLSRRETRRAAYIGAESLVARLERLKSSEAEIAAVRERSTPAPQTDRSDEPADHPALRRLRSA